MAVARSRRARTTGVGSVPPEPAQRWRGLTRDPPPVVDVEPEVIRALLLKRAKHPALTNLVGRAGVKRGVLDLFELLQSEVFMQQLGMKVVELVLVAWLPELQPLVHESHATPASE